MASGSVLVGLVGRGIGASRTPALHEAEGRAHGLLYLYQSVDFDRLGLADSALAEIVTAAERLGFRGLNVTYPFKQSIIPLLSDLDPDARIVGAVNTVVFEGGRRTGLNTDWIGFRESVLRELADVPRRQVVQLGAGGAGAAVAHALLATGTSQVVLADPQGERAETLAEQLSRRYGAGRAKAIAEPDAADLASADGLVNASPVGMAKVPGTPIPPHLLSPGLWVADVVYFPLETALLKAARARGCRTMSGAGMAVLQAAEAFRLFSGATPDVNRMLEHFAQM